ncbi:alpha/beta hydrolase [Arthrobacter sp. CAU 1506]|uniref:alpha/beta fold hydrolase n=1 Tax=Arthrobacter sp. CAU 1506 TaxID=2560052 RepID=UPI0010AB8952|nr:alpha/beta hydrolase [Arthrobacter sp. CAU 1506]TJY68818.1 alpha/beta hydrolase [Arthrobacter sp. CAU 1506]
MVKVPGETARQLTIDGCRLRLRTAGIGPEVFVLVHGIGVSARYFEPLAVELARHGTVHLVDLPGHGGLPRPDRAMDLVDLARLVHGAMTELGIGPAVLVGHSMGCQVVTELALLHPEAASALVLLAPSANRHERTAWKQGLRLFQDAFREPLAVDVIEITDYLRCGPRWYLTLLPALLRHRPEDRIAGVRVPVRIIRGSRDPIVPLYWCRELADALPGTTVDNIDGEGHVMMFRSPKPVAELCLAPAGPRGDAAVGDRP